MSNKRTVIGKFIHSTWGNLNIRCRNGLYSRESIKNKVYNNIDIKFTRDQFKDWCLANKDLIESLTRPSIDRLDKTKHYTLDNIQIIELADNIRKDKIIAKDGKSRCYRCKSIKSLNKFCKDKRRQNGYTTICIACDALRKKRTGK